MDSSFAGQQMEQEKAYLDRPRRETRRQNLERRRIEVTAQLRVIEKAIIALDAHPELEEFIETMTRANV